MKTQDVSNSKVLKGFTKGSLVIIGLFVVLYCGIAALVLNSGTDFRDKISTLILILVLASLPIILFFGFLYFVKSYYKKLFGSLGIKYEEIHHKVHKLKKMLRACPIAVKAIKPDSEKCCEELQNQLKGIKEILERLLKSLEEKGSSSGNKKTDDGGDKNTNKSKSNDDSGSSGSSQQ